VPYTDKTLTCQDCGQSFSFSADDQEFFAQKGFSEPKRCPNCRRARKNERDGGGGGGYGGGGGSRQLYPATCANCGKETEVPFQPRGDRPVYCRDCFESVRPKRY
jgi:CxxC-x17-CxxC domain-containing protein